MPPAGRRPGRLLRITVGLAASMLPTPADRRRYQAEWVVELHDLSPADQLRYASGVVSQVAALRAALGAMSTLPEEAQMPSFGRRFRCRVLRWHDWRLHSTEDGGLYRSCSVCRQDHQGQLEVPNNFRMPWR
jgi:hypothetical protein